MKSSRLSILVVLMLLLSSFAMVQCGDTSTDDNTSDDDDDDDSDDDDDDDDDDDNVSGLKISDLQNPNSPDHPMVDSDVTLNGIVITSPLFTVSENSGLRGFFASDISGGEYSGILVVKRDDLQADVAVGDKININGTYTEFCGTDSENPDDFCSTQIELAAIDFDGTAEVPAAVEIADPASIATLDSSVPETWEGHKWDGQLVTVRNVTVTEEADGTNYGMWQVDDSLRVDDIFYAYEASLDETLEFLTGFLYVSFDQSKLLPRGASDIAGAAPDCTASEQRCHDNKIQSCNESGSWTDGTDCSDTDETCIMTDGVASCTADATFTVYDMRNTDSANYLADGSPITLTGVVVTSDVFYVASALDGFFIADVGGGAWHCAVAVFTRDDLTVSVNAGDTVDLSGTVKHFCGTNSGDNQEYCIEQIQLDSVTANASAEIPAAQKIEDSSSIATGGADAYKWQSCPVYVENVTVSEQMDYGQFRVTGNLVVDDMLFDYTTPDVGTLYNTLQGFLYTSYGEFTLNPRNDNDMVSGCNAGDTRCYDNKVQACSDGSWADDTDCGDTQTCVEGDDGASCVDTSSLGVYDIQNPDSANYLDDGATVTLNNIVVTSDIVTVSSGSNLDGFFISDIGGGAWHCAIAVFKNNVLTNLSVNPGDVVTLQGSVKHFCNTNSDDQQEYCNHQIQLSALPTVTGSQEAPAAQLIDDPSTVATGGAAADQWQGCRLRLEDVSVQSNDQGYGVFALDGGLLVDTFFYLETPDVGTAYDSVEGFLYTSYGNHKLAPVEEADFVAAGGDDTDGDVDGDDTDGDVDGDDTDGDVDGDDTDGDVDGDEDLGQTPSPGDILITEFMVNPFGTDSDLEWIELYNPSPFKMNLSGLVVKDTSATTFTIPDGVSLEGGTYGTLTMSATAPTGVQNVLATGVGFGLNNTGGDSVILQLGDTMLAKIDYTEAWVTEGASTQMSRPAFAEPENHLQSYWCNGEGDYGDGHNNLGTPGAANAACPTR